MGLRAARERTDGAGRRSTQRPRRKRLRRFAATLFIVALAVSHDAFAYTIQTQITKGCHESISIDALRRVRSLGLAAPLPATDADDVPLIDDLPFSVPDDLKDIGAASLLLGNRDNDVKDIAPTELDQLAQMTADPLTQHEHCLRAGDEKEPDGTARAVADCRQFIKERLTAALDGLGADGAPDVHARETLTVYLALRGRFTVSIPRFYLHAGQAIHALQDSFTHTFRDPLDPHKITVTLDWIDYADKKINETTDGPPHMRELDRCDDPDERRAERHRLAIDASAEALHIVLDRTLSPSAKATAIDQMLDTYVVYDGSGHCSAANNWCDAPENAYRPSACGCRTAGASPGEGVGASGIVVLGALGISRRRARSRRDRPGRRRLALLVLGGVVVPRSASAQTPPPAEPDRVTLGPMAALSSGFQAPRPGAKDPTGSVFGHAAIGASYDHAALAVTLGGKYQLLRNWMVGVDAEWNPWLPTTPFGLRSGTANVYASLVRRYQMVRETVNFRTTGALGLSTLLMNLPGASAWSTGPLVGLSFIGVEWKIATGYYFVVDPTYLLFAAPHLTGAPLVYYQYRFQVGLEFGG